MNVTTITVSTDQPCAVTEQEHINMFVPQRAETVCIDETPVTIVIPQGIAGATGPQGPQGPIGNTGPQGNPGAPGIGVPSGGSAGQILAKIDGTDYNTEWIDAPDATFQESVTASELFSFIGASGLTPGKRYLISDFETRFYKLDGGVPIAGSETGGGVEGIIVTANTANTLSAVAESIVHPGDILYYDWDADNWTSDAFYSDGGVIISGWKGVITRRIDTVNNNNCTFDFRAMLYREFALTARAYRADTVYNVGSLARFNNEIYLCIVNGTVGISPTSTAYWVKVFAGIHTPTNKHWLKSSIGLTIIVPDTENFDFVEVLIGANGTSDYVDRPAFVEGCKNITMEGQPGYIALNTCIKGVTDSAVIRAKNSSFGPSSYSNVQVAEHIYSINGLSLNIGGGCNTIIIGVVASFIDIKDQSNNTIFDSACSIISCLSFRTVFGNLSGSFEAENITDCIFPKLVSSKIASGAQNTQARSVIERTEIGANMNGCLFLAGINDSKIGADYQSNRHNSILSSSSIGNNCQGNIFEGVTRCRIGDGFSDNTIPFDIEGVIGGDNFNGDDYSSATIIYQNGAKTLTKNSNGDKLIVYIDGSNVQQITSNLS